MNKCKYCGKRIEVLGVFRCKQCDIIWNKGVKHGEEKIKTKLRSMKDDLMELVE